MSGKETKEVTIVETRLAVPYFSQYRDINNSDQRLIACGMTCVCMVLAFYGLNTRTLDDVVIEGIKKGGYGESGWVHNYLVSVLKDAGLSSHREEKMADGDISKLLSSLKKESPVVVSAQRTLFDRRKFHMVLLTGYRERDGVLEGFFYHDPASLREDDGFHLFVPVKTFLLGWRRMAIFSNKE